MKRCYLSILSLLIVFTLGFSSNASARGPKTVKEDCYWDSFTVNKYESKTFPLSRCRQDDHKEARVKKIIVHANGVYYDAEVRVDANDDEKGTIYAPGDDPRYVVTIAEFTNEIEFIGTKGKMKILKIQVVYEYGCNGCRFKKCNSFHNYTYGQDIHNLATSISSRTIEVIDILEGYANYQEYGTYLLPIKKKAAVLYAKANSRTDLSRKVRVAIVQLYNQILFARDYISTTFEMDYAFDAALELLSLSEEIDSALQ